MRRAGANGELTVRVDSGLWSNDTIATLGRLGVRYTMAVRCGVKTVATAIATIPDDAWVDIDYPEGGHAQVAECGYTTGTGRRQVTRRLVVRRGWSGPSRSSSGAARTRARSGGGAGGRRRGSAGGASSLGRRTAR